MIRSRLMKRVSQEKRSNWSKTIGSTDGLAGWQADGVPASQRGLTLAELMIALPLATIILTVLFSALFTQYTAVLAESARANLRSSGQTLLINIQDELLFTIAFGETLDVDLADPHEPTDGWAHDSEPRTLIINEVALDSTRRDDDRNIVRQLINDCESSSVTANPVAINNVIYFVGDNPGNPSSDQDVLYKRTVVPIYDTCSIDTVTGDPCTSSSSATCKGGAKSTSCPEGSVGTNDCETEDSVLSENVKGMDIRYYAEDNVETDFPSAADKIEIVLTLGDTVYGRDVEVDIKHTIRKIN